jgi:hypothetical protein
MVTPVERRMNEDINAITGDTLRDKQEKKDTTVMREILNRSLKSFKVTEHVCCDSGGVRRCMSEQRAHRMNEWIDGWIIYPERETRS